MSTNTIVFIVLVVAVIYFASKPSRVEMSEQKQGPKQGRDIAPSIAQNMNLDRKIGIVPMSLYLPSQSVRYWTPVMGAEKSKPRKCEFLLSDGSRSTVYNEGIPGLYLS